MKLKIVLAVLALLTCTYAWGNGLSIHNDPVFSDDVTLWKNTEMYGTHDYFAERALEILEEQAPKEAEWIRALYFYYGTELPDSFGHDESINDRIGQYLVFDKNGHLEDNNLAKLAQKRYDIAVSTLSRGEYGTASKRLGILASYVSDAGLFSRVIENPINGNRYESNVLFMTDIVYPSSDFEETYGRYIHFDGKLEMISPYDAIVRLGQQTYLGLDGKCSAQWMDDNYDLSDPEFIDCAGRNINSLINAIVDVMHTTYQDAVNNVDYDIYAYDWESYIYGSEDSGKADSDNGGRQTTGAESEETIGAESKETTGEPEDTAIVPEKTDVAPVAPNTKPVQSTAEAEPVQKQEKTDNNMGTVAIAIVLILIIAIILLSHKRVPKAGRTKKEPSPKKARDTRRVSRSSKTKKPRDKKK